MLEMISEMMDSSPNLVARLAQLEGSFDEELLPPRKKISEQIGDLKSSIEKYYDSLKTSSSDIKERHSKKIKEKFKEINAKINTAKFTRSKDKITFLFSTMRIVVSAYILGKDPCQFPLLHTALVVLMLSMRFPYYKAIHYHYFLIEFCYWANTILMFFLWYMPTSQVLYNVSFAFSFGPLLLAAFLLKNALVPHHLDIVTSHFIHTSPGFVLVSIQSKECGFTSLEPLPFLQYMLYAFLGYLCWFVLYFFIIFILTYERGNRKNNSNLYKYSMEHQNLLSLIPSMVSEPFRPIVYMLQHMVTTHLSIAVSYAFIHSENVISGVMIFVFAVSAWNGGSYYIEYFSRKYDRQLEEVEALAKELKLAKE